MRDRGEATNFWKGTRHSRILGAAPITSPPLPNTQSILGGIIRKNSLHGILPPAVRLAPVPHHPVDDDELLFPPCQARDARRGHAPHAEAVPRVANLEGRAADRSGSKVELDVVAVSETGNVPHRIDKRGGRARGADGESRGRNLAAIEGDGVSGGGAGVGDRVGEGVRAG